MRTHTAQFSTAVHSRAGLWSAWLAAVLARYTSSPVAVCRTWKRSRPRRRKSPKAVR